MWTDSVLRSSENYLYNHIASLFHPGREGGPSPPQEKTQIQAVTGKSSVWGRQGSEPKFFSSSPFGVKHCSPQLNSHKSLLSLAYLGLPHSLSHRAVMPDPRAQLSAPSRSTSCPSREPTFPGNRQENLKVGEDGAQLIPPPKHGPQKQPGGGCHRICKRE